jgi:hypothetical protein
MLRAHRLGLKRYADGHGVEAALLSAKFSYNEPPRGKRRGLMGAPAKLFPWEKALLAQTPRS